MQHAYETCRFEQLSAKIDREIICWHSTSNIQRSFNISIVPFTIKSLKSIYVQKISSYKDLIVKKFEESCVTTDHIWTSFIWRKMKHLQETHAYPSRISNPGPSWCGDVDLDLNPGPSHCWTSLLWHEFVGGSKVWLVHFFLKYKFLVWELFEFKFFK